MMKIQIMCALYTHSQHRWWKNERLAIFKLHKRGEKAHKLDATKAQTSLTKPQLIVIILQAGGWSWSIKGASDFAIFYLVGIMNSRYHLHGSVSKNNYKQFTMTICCCNLWQHAIDENGSKFLFLKETLVVMSKHCNIIGRPHFLAKKFFWIVAWLCMVTEACTNH